MSDYITIEKGGIINEHRWNDAKRERYYSRKKKDGRYEVGLRREIREELVAKNEPVPEPIYFYDYDAADEFFRTIESNVEFDVIHLRKQCHLGDGLITNDIYDLIHKNNILSNLVSSWWPNWNSPTSINQTAIRKKLVLKNGALERHYGGHNIDLPLVVGNDELIYGNNVFTGKSYPDLMEVLIELFHCHDLPELVIRKDGVYDFYKRIPDDELINFLHYPCKIADGVILEDIFDLVTDELLKSFLTIYSSTPIDLYHEEAKREYPIVKDDWEYNFRELQLTRHIELFESEEFPMDIQDYVNFGAIGPVSEEDKKNVYKGNPPEFQTYAVEFCPTYKLKQFPLKAIDDVEIIKSIRSEHSRETIEKARYPFTLLEILDGIYFEIGFCGTPEKRDAQFDTITDRMTEVRDNPPEFDTEGRLTNHKRYISIDDMMKDIMGEDADET